MEFKSRLSLITSAVGMDLYIFLVNFNMKRLWLILLTSFSLAWAQDLILKKNNKTATIVQTQPIEIISKDNDVLKGYFLQIEKNSIVLEGSYNESLLTIPFNQVKEIKLPPSRLISAFKGCIQGGLILGGISAGIVGVMLSQDTDTRVIFDDDFDLILIAATFSYAAVIGGTLNAIRHSIKAVEVLYKIDQDNWKIVAG